MKVSIFFVVLLLLISIFYACSPSELERNYCEECPNNPPPPTCENMTLLNTIKEEVVKAGRIGKVANEKDSLTIRRKVTNIPRDSIRTKSNKVGAMGPQDDVMILDILPKMDSINGRLGFWYKVRYQDSIEGWAWGTNIRFVD